MDIRAIHDADDYAWAFGELERYFDREPEPGTPDGERFVVLAVLIEAFEAGHHAIPQADPVDVLHFRSKHRVAPRPIFRAYSGREPERPKPSSDGVPLTLDMIRAIGTAWHIPPDVLTQPYDLERTSA